MKFFTRIVVGVVHEAPRSRRSRSSEAIEGPRIWNTVKVSWRLLRRVEKSDVAQRPQRGREQPGADVDHRDLAPRSTACRKSSSGRRSSDVDDLGDVRMEAFQRALGRFGVEGAGRDVVGDEIVEQRRETVVLPTPPLSAPTKMTAGFAIAALRAQILATPGC